MVQTSNSTDIPSVGEDLGYCALVEQIIKRFFFFLMPILFKDLNHTSF